MTEEQIASNDYPPTEGKDVTLGTEAMPVVDGWDFPVGWPDGSGYYVAAGVAEPAYYERFGAWHTGEDWNNMHMGDSDWGAPVHATTNGVVIEAKRFPGWGQVLLLSHRTPEGALLWSQYAHLKDVLVGEGDVVERGQRIGTIGKMLGSDGEYTGPAHLHFEVRARRLPADAWNLERTEVLRSYLHPTDFIRSHRPDQEPIIVTVENADDRFFRSDSLYWFESPVAYGSRAYWTWTVGREQGEECFAEWRPKLRWPGFYEVFVFIPSRNATTLQACYEVHHRRGVGRVTLPQTDYYDEWVSLGAYPFSTVQAAYVRLSDMTGEPYARDEDQRKKIAFDALMWVPVEMAPRRLLPG